MSVERVETRSERMRCDGATRSSVECVKTWLERMRREDRVTRGSV